MKDLMQLSEEGYIENKETGEMEKVSVKQMLNPHKNITAEVKRLNSVISEIKDRIVTEGSQANTNTSDNALYKELILAEKELSDFLERYFYKTKSDAMYEADKLLTKDEIGIEAKILMTKRLDDLNYAKNIDSNIANDFRIALNNLYSVYDVHGKPKEGRELEIALRLQEYRKLRKEGNFYEQTEIPGLFKQAYLKKRKELEMKYPGLKSGSKKDMLMFQNELNDWLANNMTTKANDEYQVLFTEAMDTINEIKESMSSVLPKYANMISQSEKLMEQRRSIVNTYNNENGDVDGNLAPSDIQQLVKHLDLEIAKLNDEINTFLNEAEADKKIPKKDRMALKAAFKAIGKLSSQVPSEAYFIKMKELIAEEHHEVLGLRSYLAMKDVVAEHQLKDDMARENKQPTTALMTYYDNLLTLARKNASPETLMFLDDNHFEHDGKTRFTTLWRSKTFAAEYSEQTIIDETEEVLNGVPTAEYFKTSIRDEHLIDLKAEGKLNAKGTGPGPKLKEDFTDEEKLVPGWDKYINEDYYRLKNNNPKKFKVLQMLTDFHLSNQEKLQPNSRLGYDVPRFRKEFSEYTKGITKANGIKTYWQKVKSLIRPSDDDAEEGFSNYNEGEMLDTDPGIANPEDNLEHTLIDTTMRHSQGVPIQGKYRLDHEQVSDNLFRSIMRYQASGVQQNALLEKNSLVQAIKDSVSAHSKKATDSKGNLMVDKGLLSKLKEKRFLGSKEKYYREQAMQNLYDREFKGAAFAVDQKEYTHWKKPIDALKRTSSFRFFALDAASALKNYSSAQWQTFGEAVSGQHMDYKSYAKGQVWAHKAVPLYGTEIYKTGSKSLTSQMLTIFDPFNSLFEQQLGQSFNRGLKSDAANMSWLYSGRKLLENTASASLFAGMMYDTKVKYTNAEGEVTEIPYIEAFELNENKEMVLKEGIDKKYAVGGEAFLATVSKIEQVLNLNNGAYSNMSQPEYDRYVVGQLFTFMQKYLIPMLKNHWGSPKGASYNVALGGLHQGFLTGSTKAVWNMMKTDLKNVLNLGAYSNREQSMIKRTALTIILMSIANVITQILFGYDEDDSERWDKLKAKSGPVPGWFLSDKVKDEFHMSGYFSNLLLATFKGMEQETLSFTPSQQLINSVLEKKSLLSIQITDAFKLLDYTLNYDESIYNRKAGVLAWEEKGDWKGWKVILRNLGLSGNNIDVIKTTRNREAFTN